MRRVVPFVALVLLATALTVVAMQQPLTAQADPRSDDIWFDVGLQPELVEWYNRTANPGDMARVDSVSLITLLDGVTVGHRLVVFKSAALAEELVPRIADKLDIIGYNLEHGPFNPPDEQADPLASMRRVRALADRYGMRVALGPDHDFALAVGPQLAPYADLFIMQVQRVQTQPQTVRDFVVPLAEQVRRANPQVQTAVQVRSEGDVAALAGLVTSLGTSIDGVSILTSRETTQTAMALVERLRPRASARPMPSSAVQAQRGMMPWPVLLNWLLLMLGVFALILAGVILVAFLLIRRFAPL